MRNSRLSLLFCGAMVACSHRGDSADVPKPSEPASPSEPSAARFPEAPMGCADGIPIFEGDVVEDQNGCTDNFVSWAFGTRWVAGTEFTFRATFSKAFAAACDAHDRCYGRPSRTRLECDREFYDDMVAICSWHSFGDWSRVLSEERVEEICLAGAADYFKLVREWAHGAWSDAQAVGRRRWQAHAKLAKNDERAIVWLSRGTCLDWEFRRNYRHANQSISASQ